MLPKETEEYLKEFDKKKSINNIRNADQNFTDDSNS